MDITNAICVKNNFTLMSKIDCVNLALMETLFVKFAILQETILAMSVFPTLESLNQ
jgi:hypothetical protein